MKKGLLLLVMVLLLSGCSKLDSNMDKVVDNVIENKVKSNRVSNSYKYYLPLGVTNLMDYEFNGELKYKSNYLYIKVSASYFLNL